ncbi:hypothetical protein CO038_01335 [Candidatus Pacearchaeota archaeon CG_4_9_14_0_2_um_filter_39_13]|nr:MAG: hypothetical protein AUJ64_02750 [Candidatus Pacearchaeota archaeon CG1_02_39_14]PJC44932.1 MAG: hypothetical protein CO038_01335 [Candidatus Pacearchaeota archaeon CG_4_9_14_0_2_um_filter_39_13]
MMKKTKNKGFMKKGKKEPIRSLNIEEINSEHIGRVISIEGLLENVVQTSGPTLFAINDGTGTLMIKGFLAPGERAHPEIEEGDYISARVKMKEYNEAFEGEILGINELSGTEKDRVKEKMSSILRQRSKARDVEFMIKSPILDKLKEGFSKAASEIKLAVMQNRPIIVRHHNDADGYAAGYALEKAIIPLVEKQHGGGKSAWEFFTRAPCSAPFYEIDDSIRDTATSLRNVAKFSNKMPLVVIADNGSGEEDLFGIKQGRVHGMEFIVIDHHYFDEDVISAEVLAHINPFLVGEDGQKFSAGMLCSEMARFISDVENMEQIAAMSGMADRIDLMNPDAVNQYVKIAESEGYSKKLLEEIATVIDFVSAKLRFMEAREYIEIVFGEPREQQKNLVELMAPYIKNLEKKGLEMAKVGSRIEEAGQVTLQLLDVEGNFPGFGFYPKPGKVVGMLHDYIQKEKGLDSVVTVGILSSAITIRATDKAGFSVHELIKELGKKLPGAFATGGGHKNAGAITFLPNKKEEVLEIVRKFVGRK